MTPPTHQEQRDAWEKEHQQSALLPKLDSGEPSGGLVRFLAYLKGKTKVKDWKAVEMACGKGRNIIWLAKQGVEATGTDFSTTAIRVATKRAKAAGVTARAHFLVHDATLPYPLAENSFDLAIDCFGSTDIETVEFRRKAIDNLIKLIKPGGYLFSYLIDSSGQYHQLASKYQPLKEKGSFIHQISGKFEKNFDEAGVRKNYQGLKLIALEKIDKEIELGAQSQPGRLIWSIFQKESGFTASDSTRLKESAKL